jgi:arginyl-tRNA synthetase
LSGLEGDKPITRKFAALMPSIVDEIRKSVSRVINDLYQQEIGPANLTINSTNPDFEGDYTLVLFSFIKLLKKSPEQLGKEIGEALIVKNPSLFTGFNVIKGFLNLNISDEFWTRFLDKHYSLKDFGRREPNGKTVMVEYSSPNTNKPLHLGHLRNNFLGWSVAQLLKESGYSVIKSCIVNDRGIHICKSMLAWKKFGKGETPASTGMKGDHFVGFYYVKLNDVYKKEVESLVAAGMSKEQAEKEAPIMKETQQMLLDWEAGKPDVIELWKKMNSWVYEGFDVTYRRIGSDFDITYYESDTYLLGKKSVEEGLAEGVFRKKDDGSVWADLTAEGLDEKLVLRKDGTSVYMTQDLGLAQQKYEQFHYDQSIYVVGDEQNYHLKALKIILQKMKKPYAEGVHHLSYGMVELPTGRMKSREGTVVDADDLIDEMVKVARDKTEELGKVKDFTENELIELYDILALGALKFFLLRVDPKKRMVFNPEESIDFHGFTGPFVQYTHARIKSILRKAGSWQKQFTQQGLHKMEKDLLIQLEQYPVIIDQAVMEHNPSVVAIYVFNLAKSFNTFYTELSVLSAESEEKKQLRLAISEMTANVIASGMRLLGILVPERM